MTKRIFTVLILAVFLFAFMSMSAMAVKSPTEKRAGDKDLSKIVAYSFPDERGYYDDALESLVGLSHEKSGRGFGYKLGDSYYEYQHNSTVHRQIEHGSSASCAWTLHADWMYLPSGVLVNREILYQGWDGVGGAPVNLAPYADFQQAGEYAGYPSIAVTGDNRAVICAHNDLDAVATPGVGYASTVYMMYGCNMAFHSAYFRVPRTLTACGNLYNGSTTGADDVVWPGVAWQDMPGEEYNIVHMVACAFAGGNGASNFHYIRGEIDEILIPPEVASVVWTNWCAIDTIFNGEAYDIDANADGRVAVVWTANPPAAGDPCDTCSQNSSLGGTIADRYNNDLYYQLNDNYGIGIIGTPYDGATNYWQNRVNLTQIPVGDDGLKPASELSVLYTTDGVLHIAWIANDFENPSTSYFRGRIMHWSEELGWDGDGIANIRTVSTAQWDPENCGPGAFNSNQAKLAVSECDTRLYVMWVEYNSPHTTGNDSHDDCAADAFTGGGAARANGDLMLAVSGQGVGNPLGLMWDAPRPITDTYGGPNTAINPLGACDPDGAGGPCPSESWPTMASYGQDYAISGPATSNVVAIDDPESYTGDFYLDIAFMDDTDPGGAINGEGQWRLTDYLWVRVPCVEPVPAPGFVMSPDRFVYPNCVKHCEEEVVEVTLENTGNAEVTYSVAVENDNATYPDAIEEAGFGTSLPSGFGNTVIGTITLNPTGAGQICTPTTIVEVNGRVIFDHDAPQDKDTFLVQLVVADTCFPITFDTVATSCVELIVGSNSNAGNGGAPGYVNMNFDTAYCTPGYDWNRGALLYLYDASTIAGYPYGDDVTANWGMFQVTLGDTAMSLIPFGGEDGTTYDETWADVFYTGKYTNNDSTVAFETKFYAPTPAAGDYSCAFIIKETIAYSNDGAAHTGVMVGEAGDWDVPSDSGSSNSSGSGNDASVFSPTIDHVVWQRGYENGTDDSLELADCGWDADTRFGGFRFLRTYFYDAVTTYPDPASWNTSPHGMYTADNPTYVYPFDEGFDPDLLYGNHAQTGINISDSMHHDLHLGLTYVHEYDLDVDDTLWFYVGYFSQMTTVNPDSKTLQENVEDIWNYFAEYLQHNEGCCVVPGDVNHSGTLDISDLTYYVSFMFSGGPPAPCFQEGDINGSCTQDISDLTYIVDYMFGGGPDPICADDCK